MLLPYLLLAVYILAINLYAFQLVRSQRRAAAERGAGSKTGNAKLFLAGVLGGALGAYAMMLALRFKTDHLLPMIVLPLLIVLNAYLVVTLLRNGILVIA